ATGSGIAPFLSFSKSHLNINLTIIHGIRDVSDSLIAELPSSVYYIICNSKTKVGDYFGRVTNYVKKIIDLVETYYYLCGNGEMMIHEIYMHLKKQNVSRENIFYEEYFNN
ncbi:MAG: oxidoreductase, partial [Bacteroidota bacterium]|nr:oxidoreductase [Bacteroidota bacterium]